jgi:hypothetical protein
MLRDGRPGFYSWKRQEIFSFLTAFRPRLGPTQPRIQWAPGALSSRVKRQGHEADLSSPCSAEVNNDGPLPPLPHTILWPGA